MLPKTNTFLIFAAFVLFNTKPEPDNAACASVGSHGMRGWSLNKWVLSLSWQTESDSAVLTLEFVPPLRCQNREESRLRWAGFVALSDGWTSRPADVWPVFGGRQEQFCWRPWRSAPSYRRAQESVWYQELRSDTSTEHQQSYWEIFQKKFPSQSSVSGPLNQSINQSINQRVRHHLYRRVQFYLLIIC